MRKINPFIRILSVFLVVVMVSVTFMQPVVHAFAAAVPLVLLVAGMLIAAGVVFASPAEAYSMSEYAIAGMPQTLLGKISEALSAGMAGIGVATIASYQMFENGFNQFVQIEMTLWQEFKNWVDKHIKHKSDEIISGGAGGIAPEAITFAHIDAIFTWNGITMPPVPLKKAYEAGYRYFVLDPYYPVSNSTQDVSFRAFFSWAEPVYDTSKKSVAFPRVSAPIGNPYVYSYFGHYEGATSFGNFYYTYYFPDAYVVLYTSADIYSSKGTRYFSSGLSNGCTMSYGEVSDKKYSARHNTAAY